MTNTAYYDNIASGYNELHKEEQIKKINIISRELKKRVNTSILNNSIPIIDVGCGTGFSLDSIAESVGIPCVGIEPSLGMVKQYSGKQELLISRAESLPFPDDFACACVSITAIQNFDDVAQGVQEMLRVTKKDGPIIISCLKKSPQLGYIAEVLADLLVVEDAIEEEKDIIFVCINNKVVKALSEDSHEDSNEKI